MKTESPLLKPLTHLRCILPGGRGTRPWQIVLAERTLWQRLVAALVYVCYITSPMAGIFPSHHLRAAGLSVDARSPSFFGEAIESLKSAPPPVSVETVRVGLRYAIDRIVREAVQAHDAALPLAVSDPIARIRSRSIERAARADSWLQWADSVSTITASLTRSRSSPESTLSLTKSLLGSRFVNNNLTAGSITNIGSTIIAGGGISNMVGTGTAGNVTNQDVNLNLTWSGTYNGSPVGGAITQDPTKTGAQAIIQAGSLNIQNLNNAGIIVANTATITGTSVNGISDPAVRTVIPDGRRDPYTPATGPGTDTGNANTAPPPSGPCGNATVCVNGTPYTYVAGNTTDPNNPVPGHYIDGKGATVGNPLAANPNATGTVNRNNPNLFVNVTGTASGSTLAHIDNVTHGAPTHIGAAGITGPPGAGTTSPRANVKVDATVLDPNDPNTLTEQGGVPAKPGNPGTPASVGINAPNGPLVPLKTWKPGDGTIDTRGLIPVAPSGNLFVAGTLNLNGGTFTNTGFIHANTIVLDHVDLINAQRLAEVHNTTIEGKKLWTVIDGYGAQPGAFISAAHWQINNSTLDADGNPIDPGSIVCKGNCTFDIPEASKEELSAFLAALKGVYGDNLTFQQLEEFLRYSKHDSRKWYETGIFAVVLAVIAFAINVMCSGCLTALLVSFLNAIGLGSVAALIGAGGILGAAVTAGITTLLTQLAQAAVTGEWNLERILKAVLLAAVTAGLTQGALDVLDGVLKDMGLFEGLVDAAGKPISSLKDLGQTAGKVTDWGQYAAAAATKAVVQAGVTTLVNGGNFENAFLSSFVNNLSPGVAGVIGDVFQTTAGDIGSIAANALVHAAAGCALAAAKKESCEAGAIGAGVGALAANAATDLFDINPLTEEGARQIEAISRLTAIGTVAAAGKSDAVATADFFAQNEVLNNFLSTAVIRQALGALKDCSGAQCDAIRNILNGSGSQISPTALIASCEAGQATCAGGIQTIADGLTALRDPQTRALLGDDVTDRLISRQLGDLNAVLNAAEKGSDPTRQAVGKLVMTALVSAGLFALGGGALVLTVRAGMAACGSGIVSPACIEFATTLTGGIAEGVVGVPAGTAFVGVGALSATAVAERMTLAASRGSAAVAFETKVIAQEIAISRALGGSSGNAVEGTSFVVVKDAVSASRANASWVATHDMVDPITGVRWAPPYKAGTDVFSTVTTTETNFVRFGEGAGQWLVPESVIAGKSPAEIQQLLALPSPPTQIMNVTIPPGTRLEFSTVGPQPFGPGGAIQVRIDAPRNPSWFAPPRKFP